MLLQPTSSKSSLSFHHQNQNHALFKQPIIVTLQTHKNPILIKGSSISKSNTHETVDYEKRAISKWNSISRRISTLENPQMGSASVLNQMENEGKKLSKWELCKVVKALRKFRRFKYALEVNNNNIIWIEMLDINWLALEASSSLW